MGPFLSVCLRSLPVLLTLNDFSREVCCTMSARPPRDLAAADVHDDGLESCSAASCGSQAPVPGLSSTELLSLDRPAGRSPSLVTRRFGVVCHCREPKAAALTTAPARRPQPTGLTRLKEDESLVFFYSTHPS